MLPQWLLRDEQYFPERDRDIFIDRSIRTLLTLLSRLRQREGGSEEKVRVNPGVRLGSTLLLILLLSLSRDFLFVAYAGALLLAILSVYRAELILRVLKTSLPIATFTLFVMLPSALWGNTSGLIMITLKVFFSVVAVKMFVSTAEWGSILGGLRIFMPRLFILVLDVTTRYLVLLGELSVSLLVALKLRSVGRNSRKQSSLAGVTGTLFLRSRQMAEEMYAAMECRCFTGSYPRGSTAKISAVDLVPLGVGALTVAVFAWTGMR